MSSMAKELLKAFEVTDSSSSEDEFLPVPSKKRKGEKKEKDGPTKRAKVSSDELLTSSDDELLLSQWDDKGVVSVAGSTESVKAPSQTPKFSILSILSATKSRTETPPAGILSLEEEGSFNLRDRSSVERPSKSLPKSKKLSRKKELPDTLTALLNKSRKKKSVRDRDSKKIKSIFSAKDHQLMETVTKMGDSAFGAQDPPFTASRNAFPLWGGVVRARLDALFASVLGNCPKSLTVGARDSVVAKDAKGATAMEAGSEEWVHRSLLECTAYCDIPKSSWFQYMFKIAMYGTAVLSELSCVTLQRWWCNRKAGDPWECTPVLNTDTVPPCTDTEKGDGWWYPGLPEFIEAIKALGFGWGRSCAVVPRKEKENIQEEPLRWHNVSALFRLLLTVLHHDDMVGRRRTAKKFATVERTALLWFCSVTLNDTRVQASPVTDVIEDCLSLLLQSMAHSPQVAVPLAKALCCGKLYPNTPDAKIMVAGNVPESAQLEVDEEKENSVISVCRSIHKVMNGMLCCLAWVYPSVEASSAFSLRLAMALWKATQEPEAFRALECSDDWVVESATDIPEDLQFLPCNQIMWLIQHQLRDAGLELSKFDCCKLHVALECLHFCLRFLAPTTARLKAFKDPKKKDPPKHMESVVEEQWMQRVPTGRRAKIARLGEFSALAHSRFRLMKTEFRKRHNGFSPSSAKFLERKLKSKKEKLGPSRLEIEAEKGKKMQSKLFGGKNKQ